MEPHAFSVLGGVDKPQDNRDIQLGALAVAKPIGYTYPPTFTNTGAFNMVVEYQGQQPACGAHAGTALAGVQDGARYAPRFTWANIKSFDGNSLEAGTDMRSIFKSLTKMGPLDQNLMMNDVALSLQDYAHPLINQFQTNNANANKEPGYGFWSDKTFSGLKQYISDHGAIILLVRVGNEWWQAPNGQPSWLEKDILPLRTPSPVVSGHFIVAHSYDSQYIYFLNSFGQDWGRMGHGYFGENYMPYINDAGTLIGLLFSKDLSYGMTDPEVKQLQQLLNKDPRTRLAISGPGSAGQETSYFGPNTKAAVIKFQKLYSINPPAGYVGVLTRAVLNGVADS